MPEAANVPGHIRVEELGALREQLSALEERASVLDGAYGSLTKTVETMYRGETRVMKYLTVFSGVFIFVITGAIGMLGLASYSQYHYSNVQIDRELQNMKDQFKEIVGESSVSSATVLNWYGQKGSVGVEPSPALEVGGNINIASLAGGIPVFQAVVEFSPKIDVEGSGPAKLYGLDYRIEGPIIDQFARLKGKTDESYIRQSEAGNTQSYQQPIFVVPGHPTVASFYISSQASSCGLIEDLFQSLSQMDTVGRIQITPIFDRISKTPPPYTFNIKMVPFIGAVNCNRLP